MRVSKVQKFNFVPRLCPRHSRDVFFCPFFVCRALRGTKMPIFEVKSDAIQTSAKYELAKKNSLKTQCICI